MKSIVIMQVSGGSGASTLAMNLVHASVWPKAKRVLLSLNPADSGDIFFQFGFPDQNSIYLDPVELYSETSIVSLGYDVGLPDRRMPSKLALADPENWVLPIVPQPTFTSPLDPRQSPWWDILLSKSVDADVDTVIDAGRILPDYYGIHRRLFEFADDVYLLISSEWELEKAKAVASRYSAKTTLVLVGDAVNLEEKTDPFGFTKTLLMPKNDKMASEFARATVATSAKPRLMRGYLQLLAEITEIEE